ncbi:MAG: excinuclease ABC subunit A, partial [Planctomycetota bacterium]
NESPAAASGTGTEKLPDAGRTPFVPRGVTVLTGPSAECRLEALAKEAGAAERFGPFGAVLHGPRAPLTKSPRSTVATFLGFFGEIRDLFASTPEAKLRGFTAGQFSLAGASPGRCPVCEGAGTVTTPMQFLPDLVTVCPECGGDRFTPETLAIRVRGLSIAETLNLTADEAVPFFRGRPKPRARAAAVRDVGLGRLTIGRAVNTLSHGEGQRLRLAKTLAARTAAATLILLEAPAAGLHPVDAERLVGVFRRLAENGHAVVATGVHPQLLAAADAVVAVE